MTDLATIATRLEQALADRWPGQAFSVTAFDFDESLHVRWFDGPMDYTVQQVAKRIAPADVPVMCARWWTAGALQPLVERLAQSYRKPIPQIVEWQTAEGLTRAWLAGDTENLGTYRDALAMQDLYQPPAAAEPEPVNDLLADYSVASARRGNLVRMKVREDCGRRVLRFSGQPAHAVLEALNGLDAIWNPYRKTWTTGASLARI